MCAHACVCPRAHTCAAQAPIARVGVKQILHELAKMLFHAHTHMFVKLRVDMNEEVRAHARLRFVLNTHAQTCTRTHTRVLGGPWDFVITYNWTYNPTYNWRNPCETI